MGSGDFQVAVLGSGFGGSLMALIARRLGYSTVLLERGKHPRFTIGESTTPLTNLLLEELSTDYGLSAIRPLCKWGTWQAATPQLACGLKRGFTFYHHDLDRPFEPDTEGRRQLLVAASPDDAVADTHWYRPQFDHYLVQQAVASGVEYLDETELSEVEERSAGMRLAGTRRGERLNLTADFVIDATGPRGLLFRTLNLGEAPLAELPPTQGLFSHFEQVSPLPEALLQFQGRTPPYPPESAAVHHIFPGGWIWVLKFNNGITSAGVAATDPLAQALNLRAGASGWGRLLKRLPVLEGIFRPANAIMPFVHQPRIAFQCARITGRHWALLPSAAGVIDPLLSTGFPLSLLGICRLARMLQFDRDPALLGAALEHYGRITKLELETTARLVGAMYGAMDCFEVFKALSLLYFAAASFSEIARRLGKPHLADSFLLSTNREFSSALRELCLGASKPLSEADRAAWKQRLIEAITPFDLIGLTDRQRDPWYPARAEDISRNLAKLGVASGNGG